LCPQTEPRKNPAQPSAPRVLRSPRAEPEPDTDASRRVRQAGQSGTPPPAHRHRLETGSSRVLCCGGPAGAWPVAAAAAAASSSSGQCTHSMRYLGEVTAAIWSSSFVSGQFLRPARPRHAAQGDAKGHGQAPLLGAGRLSQVQVPTEQGGGAKCLVHPAISNF